MGKTSTAYAPPSPTGKHPHLRGENPYSGTFIPTLWETSPPAWGKLRERVLDSITAGNIPTCVGKTKTKVFQFKPWGKHPHLRGENRTLTVGSSIASETSPPAWGKHSLPKGRNDSLGNIPTCVGKTARFCLDCHSGYYILLKSKFLALSLRQGRAIFAYHPSLGIDLRLAEAQRDVPNDCGGRVIKGRLLPN